MPLKNKVNVVTNITNDIAVSANVSIRNPISVRSGGSGSGKGSLERFITFDQHFEHFYFTEDVENFSVVGQIAHARYMIRTKSTRHGININSWTGPDTRFFGIVPGEKYFRTCSRNTFSRINNDEGYRFEAIDYSEQQPYGVIDNIFKYWFGSECTGYTPNEFLPVFKTWGAAEVLERVYKTIDKWQYSIESGKDFRLALYNGNLDHFDFDRSVSGRFYLVPINLEDFETIYHINIFDLKIEDLQNAIDGGEYLSCGNKRISIKFIKNIELVRDEAGHLKYWTGKMNAISLFIRGNFRCIDNKWYMCYYVMPDVVEKSRY